MNEGFQKVWLMCGSGHVVVVYKCGGSFFKTKIGLDVEGEIFHHLDVYF